MGRKSLKSIRHECLVVLAIAAWMIVASASAAANPIQQENLKPGTSGWQLANPATQHEIEGYASLTSVNRGGQILLYVNCSDPSYDIDIFRMGWYGGLGARQVAGTVVQTGVVQVVPAPDPNTGLVECAWVNPYVLTVPDNPQDPTDWASGVYLAKLTGVPSGKQSYVIFVVRDDERCSDFLFQSSVTTFQAYNSWGGVSLYGFDGDACVPLVSFNRPYFTKYPNVGTGIGAGEFLTNEQPDWSTIPVGWEYNMVRFLEHEGYDVTYCTDVDTHESAALLLTHKAFLSVGHDEYWSWPMREHVEGARDAGVNLGFFSANTCYWQIRLETSPATGAPNRTVVCYKDGACGVGADPLSNDGDPTNDYLITDLWRSATVNRPEDGMMGPMYNFWPVNSYDVVVSNASHWVFASTGLQDGDHLPGLVGYEADGLWSSAPPGITVLAHSPVPNTSHPTVPIPDHSDMTIYQAPSGALVFATGTIQWSWGLDDYNADAAVGPVLRTSWLSPAGQQITRNVLAAMGPNLPPDCSHAVASEAVLWPANHKYHTISILGVTDPDSCDVVTITVTGITQDEPVNTRGDGNTCPDGQIMNGAASVRAERNGTPGLPGNGRVYVISFTASDGRGGSCNGSVSVCVPHDQGKGKSCIDDGQKHNSLGPCTGGAQLTPEITEVGLTVGTVTGSQVVLEFALPTDTQVELSVFDVAGRRLATVENGTLAAGVHQRAWDMSGAAKGLYFVRLHAGAVTLTKTVVKIQ